MGAACGGVVVNTRGVGARSVTLRCGRWRVTHLPLASVAVRTGQHVHAGALLGTLAASADHAGLHLGVRRAGDAFGYVDPLQFLPGSPREPPAIPRVGPRWRRIQPRSAPAPHAAPAPTGEPAARAAPAPHAAPGTAPLAPWPAWAGLVLLLCGALGGGVRLRVRRRAGAAAAAEPAR